MNITHLQLNIWTGGKLMDNIIALVQKEKPNIISMQEVFNGTLSTLSPQLRSFFYLKEQLNFPYAVFAPAYRTLIENNEVEQGNAIFSSFPITPIKTVFYDKPYRTLDSSNEHIYDSYPRNVQIVQIDINNTKLTVANTHGIWGKDGADNERRLQMSKTIVDNLMDRKNVILSGDFNVTEKTKTISHIEQYYKNVFKDELETSFNMEHKDNPGYASAVVDMVFVSPNLTVRSHTTSDMDVSDHKALLTTIELQ